MKTMKKSVCGLMLVALAAVVTTTGCGPSKAELAEKARQDSIRIADSLRQVEEQKAAEAAKAEETRKTDSIARDQSIIAFITDMFLNRKYEDESFLKAYCTPSMIQKLKDDYDYEGEGLAVWDFRSDEQDGDGATRIISIVPQGDDWFKYDFLDMGHRGSHRIKIIGNDGDFKIDGLK